ncbi:MAG TPA: GDSL-type esterase/lipase family protein [Sedimentisphaerales bacterium]|nr:GDSL-type esterase/lipase family protein [Sedimentisphaerales bacterium]
MAKHRRIVLTIGDSNGAAADGWPVWLRGMVRADVFMNNSESGRTLGFDNPDAGKNGLANVGKYMDAAILEAGEGLDDVVVMLGTNDCKACFAERQGEIEANLRKMVELIRKHDNGGKWSPRVTIVAPPPYGLDEKMLEKYRGGAARAKALSRVYRQVAQEMHTRFVDGHAVLEPVWDEVSVDGVHMGQGGQRRLAEAAAQVLG